MICLAVLPTYGDYSGESNSIQKPVREQTRSSEIHVKGVIPCLEKI